MAGFLKTYSAKISLPDFKKAIPIENRSDLGSKVCTKVRNHADLGSKVCTKVRNHADLGSEVCTKVRNYADLGSKVCTKVGNHADLGTIKSAIYIQNRMHKASLKNNRHFVQYIPFLKTIPIWGILQSKLSRN